MTPAITLLPIILMVLIAATSLWVYQDATAHADRGRPVYFSVGAIEVSTPGAWTGGCLCLWFIFTPLYLTCRKNA